MRASRFAAELKHCTDLSACSARFMTEVAPFGFDSFACGEVDLRHRERTTFFAIHWPEDWRRFYLDRTSCFPTVAPLLQSGATTATPPSCGPIPQGDERAVLQGSTNLDTKIITTYEIAEARTDTVIETVSETWELNGHVVPVGTIHAAVQSGLYDLAGRLLRRLPEQPRGLWAEPYYLHVRQGDSRESWGVAGGFAFEAAPGLTLGIALDHGWSDLSGVAGEGGKLQLTEVGATAHFAGGPFTAALSGVYGFGSAETTRSFAGSSSASYDVRIAGAALDLGYALTAGPLRVTPVAGVDYVAIHSDGFTESDTLGLTAPDHDSHRWRASGGVELSADAGRVTLSASARYVAVLEGEARSLPIAFAIAPGMPLVMQGPPEPDTAQLSARARFGIVKNAALTLGYDGRFGTGYTQHAAFAAVSVNW
jgi:hypothetical protein